MHYHETAVGVEEHADIWKVATVGRGVSRRIAAKEIVDCSGNADVVGLLGLERERAEIRQPGAAAAKRPRTAGNFAQPHRIR